jgi:hypothetical protein
MSDLELLFLVLALLYAWECACWFHRGSAAVRTWLGRRWKIVHPGALLGNQRGGFIFAPPLPPLGRILAGHQLPLSVSPQGALACVAPSLNPGWRPPQSGSFLPWDQVQTARAAGRKVLANGRVLLRTDSPSFARHLARLLRELGAIPAGERERAIQKLFHDSLDDKAVRRRWQQFLERTGVMRVWTNSLVLFLFLLAPLVIRHWGLKRTWPALGAVLLAHTLATAFLFLRAHKALFAGAREERFTHFLTTLLSPATAARALDLLSRELLDSFHPLAIAGVFCPRAEFESFAERILREIRYPALPTVPSNQANLDRIERSSRAALQAAVESFLERMGIDPAKLVQPPAPADATCRSYCPRCRAQFTAGAETCPDCGGLRLVAFATPPAATR